ncbi:MAG: hypothetical protein ACK4Z6_08070, partial [Candidatus Methylomirabilales bacterium]
MASLRTWLLARSLLLVVMMGIGILLVGSASLGEAAPEKAPAFTLKLFSGEDLRFADLQGT